MKKLNQKFLMVLLGLMMVGTASAVNWGSIGWLGNGGVDAKYNNSYKIGANDEANLPGVVNMTER